ncbi:MAG: hypothetical protein CUN53_01490 [Phototrophicales bacterium]|nr:MAG: hypothetical protein CUN53_01490 [Phototrophicales bacterium]
MFDMMAQFSKQRRDELMREAQRERLAREARAAWREAMETAQMRHQTSTRRVLELAKNQAE